MTENPSGEAPVISVKGASRNYHRWSEADLAQVEDLAGQFKTYSEIGDILGVTKQAVAQAVQKYELKVPDRAAKLSEQKKQQYAGAPHLCTKCGETDPEKFYSGSRSRCKACKVAWQSEYQKTESWKAVNTKAQLKFKYGMTQEQYDEMLEAQGGVCKICRKPSTNKRKTGVTFRLAVDHLHSCCPGNKSCGKCIVGLLCLSCNNKIEWYRKYEDAIRAYENADL